MHRNKNLQFHDISLLENKEDFLAHMGIGLETE